MSRTIASEFNIHKAANIRQWLARVNERPSLKATSGERVAALAKVA
jgi:hypothetical protein